MLTALYTVRSERLFCEQLGYNLLWLWFLDREFHEGSFERSVFAKNYERVLSADVARIFSPLWASSEYSSNCCTACWALLVFILAHSAAPRAERQAG